MGIFSDFFKKASVSKLAVNTDMELATELNDIPIYNPYVNYGLHIDRSENQLKLIYNGILAQSGADEVYAVVGYGENRNWKDVGYYKMQSAGEKTFEMDLPLSKRQSYNVVFKDSASNWDNNSGLNYVIRKSFSDGNQ